MSATTQPMARMRFLLVLVMLFCGASLALPAQDPPPCSLSKTNKSCELVIDRSNPVAPSIVQMYSDQELTVRIKNPLPFERYFLDFTTGQAALTPDVASSIVGGMFAGLAKTQIGNSRSAEVIGTLSTLGQEACANPHFSEPMWPPQDGVKDGQKEFRACFAILAGKATAVYKSLEPLIAPDSLTPGTNGEPAVSQEPEFYRTHYASINEVINTYVNLETTVSTKITALTKVPTQQATPPAQPLPLVYSSSADQTAITQLVDDQKIIDAIAADLLGYRQRLVDLGPCSYGSNVKGDTIAAACPAICDVVITSRKDQPRIYRGMVTRTITYSLDALNLVSNSQQAVPNTANKKALAVVAINFADSPNKFLGVPLTAFRFEASAGIYFSTLPNRTFTLDAHGNVQDSKTRPTPIPFAAANYRLTDDLPGKWKQNFYLTGTVGVNPNTTTTDFGAGISYAWRALMLSALCDFGHDVRPTKASLTSGSTSSLPTSSHWTQAFAIGISVRIPSLTGR